MGRVLLLNSAAGAGGMGKGVMEITFREKKWELKGGSAARDTIRKIGLDPESVLVIVNGKLSTDDIILKDDDRVKLVAVVSGG